MNTDSVSVAFQIILEEIGTVVSEVNSQGAAFLRNGDYQKAEDVIASGKKLAAFTTKLDALKQEWIAGLDEPTRAKVQVESNKVARTISSSHKSPKTVLVVKFPDGAVLFEAVAADTFAKSLKKLGLQRVSEVGMKVCNHPLVSKQRSASYNQTEIDGYLVMTHSNTEDKRRQLLEIASALKVGLSVDVVPAKDV
jgi:hypothetical protein